MRGEVNRHIATALFFLSILCSLISQTPFIMDAGGDKVLKLIWVLPLGYTLFTTPQNFLSNRLMPFYGFYLLFFLYCFACQMFTGRQYLGADLYNIAICMMITMVSYAYWLHYGSLHVLQLICASALLCGVFLALEVYVNYLIGSNIMSASYAFEEKNSMGQILLCVAFISLLFFKPSDRRLLLVSRLLAGFILLIMIMLKSRATLVSGFYMLYYVTLRKGSKKLKLTIILVGLLFVAVLLASADVYNVIVNGILFGGRDSSDINSLSSNRVILFAIALKLIPQHPWIGSGEYYVDCLPLNLLTEYGIIGLTMVLAFMWYLFRSLNQKVKSPILTAAYVLYMSFVINGMFEAYPPFGPGVKCFILWMFYGFALAEATRDTHPHDHPQLTTQE